jgi:hypothetical protein
MSACQSVEFGVTVAPNVMATKSAQPDAGDLNFTHVTISHLFQRRYVANEP